MKRIIIFIIATCAFFAQVQAQRLIVNGYKYGGGSPTLPTMWARYKCTAGNLTVDGSNNVSNLTDISGNLRPLSATSTARPVWNGTDAITVSNSGPQYLSRATGPSGAYTIYILISIANVTTGCYPYLDKGIFSSPQHNMTVASGQVSISSNNGTTNLSVTSPANNTYALVRAVYNGASSALGINTGNTTGTSGTRTQQGAILIGIDSALSTANFSFKEIMIVPTAIASGSADDIAVKAYFTTTYGIP